MKGLELQCVSAQWYRRIQIDGHDELRSISIRAEEGEWILVAGENGIGKSTLLHAIAGRVPHVTGRIEVDSVVLKPHDFYARFVAGVAMVPQHESLRLKREGEQFSLSDAIDYFRFARPALFNESAINDLIVKLHGKSAFNGNLISPRMFDLLVAILSVPRVLLLDEISTDWHTDDRETTAIYTTIKELLPNAIVLFVDHDAEEAMETADKVLWLRKDLGDQSPKRDSAPILFSPSREPAQKKRLLTQLGVNSTFSEEEQLLEKKVKAIVRLNRSVKEQVQLAVQAHSFRSRTEKFSSRYDLKLESTILDRFTFLDTSNPAEVLSGGRRIVLLWLLLELSKIEELPDNLLNHVDRHNRKAIDEFKDVIHHWTSQKANA